MKNLITLSIALACLFILGCASESSPPSAPGFIPPETTSEEERESAEEAEEEENRADETSNDAGTDSASPNDAGDEEVPELDVEDTEDESSGNDATVTDADVADAADDSVDADDTIQDGGDGGLLPDDSTSPPDTKTSDTTTPGDEDIADSTSTEEDTEEPGECETDDDCQILTTKSCCPEINVCVPIPEVGTLTDEIQAVAWIGENCLSSGVENEATECPELVAPACTECWNVFNYAAICDKVVGECVLEKEPSCDEYCNAVASAPEETCPLVSEPDSLQDSLFEECNCP